MNKLQKKHFQSFIISTLLFSLVLYSLHWHGFLFQLNMPTQLFFNSFNQYSTTITSLLIWISHLGDKYVIALTMLAISLWYVFYQQWWIAFHWIGLACSSYFAIWLLKKIINYPRPLQPLIDSTTEGAFPSGHTTLIVILAGMLWLTLHQQFTDKQKITYGLFMFFTVIIIAISRLYLNMHWLTDILGGIFLGLSLLHLIGISYYYARDIYCQKNFLPVFFGIYAVFYFLVIFVG